MGSLVPIMSYLVKITSALFCVDSWILLISRHRRSEHNSDYSKEYNCCVSLLLSGDGRRSYTRDMNVTHSYCHATIQRHHKQVLRNIPINSKASRICIYSPSPWVSVRSAHPLSSSRYTRSSSFRTRSCGRRPCGR